MRVVGFVVWGPETTIRAYHMTIEGSRAFVEVTAPEGCTYGFFTEVVVGGRHRCIDVEEIGATARLECDV